MSLGLSPRAPVSPSSARTARAPRTRLPRLEGADLKESRRPRPNAPAASNTDALRAGSERQRRLDVIKRNRRRRHASEDICGDWNDNETTRKWDNLRHERERERERNRVALQTSECEQVSESVGSPIQHEHAVQLPQILADPHAQASGAFASQMHNIQSSPTDHGRIYQFKAPPPEAVPLPRPAETPRDILTPTAPLTSMPRPPPSPRVQTMLASVGSPSSVQGISAESEQEDPSLVMPFRLETMHIKPSSPSLDCSELKPSSPNAASCRGAPSAMTMASEGDARMDASSVAPLPPTPQFPQSMVPEPSKTLSGFDEDDADEPLPYNPHDLLQCGSPLFQLSGGAFKSPSHAGSTNVEEIRCDPEPSSQLAALYHENVGAPRATSCACGSEFMLDSIFCRMCGAKRPIEIPVAPSLPAPQSRFNRKDLVKKHQAPPAPQDTEENAAALRIQARCRGQQTRKELTAAKAAQSSNHRNPESASADEPASNQQQQQQRHAEWEHLSNHSDEVLEAAAEVFVEGAMQTDDAEVQRLRLDVVTASVISESVVMDTATIIHEQWDVHESIALDFAQLVMAGVSDFPSPTGASEAPELVFCDDDRSDVISACCAESEAAYEIADALAGMAVSNGFAMAGVGEEGQACSPGSVNEICPKTEGVLVNASEDGNLGELLGENAAGKKGCRVPISSCPKNRGVDEIRIDMQGLFMDALENGSFEKVLREDGAANAVEADIAEIRGETTALLASGREHSFFERLLSENSAEKVINCDMEPSDSSCPSARGVDEIRLNMQGLLMASLDDGSLDRLLSENAVDPQLTPEDRNPEGHLKESAAAKGKLSENANGNERGVDEIRVNMQDLFVAPLEDGSLEKSLKEDAVRIAVDQAAILNVPSIDGTVDDSSLENLPCQPAVQKAIEYSGQDAVQAFELLIGGLHNGSLEKLLCENSTNLPSEHDDITPTTTGREDMFENARGELVNALVSGSLETLLTQIANEKGPEQGRDIDKLEGLPAHEFEAKADFPQSTLLIQSLMSDAQGLFSEACPDGELESALREAHRAADTWAVEHVDDQEQKEFLAEMTLKAACNIDEEHAAPLDLSLDFLGSPDGNSPAWEEVEQVEDDVPAEVPQLVPLDVERPADSQSIVSAAPVQAKPPSLDDLINLKPVELQWLELKAVGERPDTQLPNTSGCPKDMIAGSGGCETQTSLPADEKPMTPDWLRERYGQLRKSEGSRPASRGSGEVPPAECITELTSLEAFQQKLSALSSAENSALVPRRSAGNAVHLVTGKTEMDLDVDLMQLPPPPDFEPPACPEGPRQVM